MQSLYKEHHVAMLGAGGQVDWKRQEGGKKVKRKRLKNVLRKDKDGLDVDWVVV